MFADERCRTLHLDHGEPSACGRNGIAFFRVSLFSNPQRVQLRLEGAPIDYFRGSWFIFHKVFHHSLRYAFSHSSLDTTQLSSLTARLLSSLAVLVVAANP